MNLVTAAIDVSILIVLALGATRLLRGHSAALRHWVLGTTVMFALAMPLFEAAMPSWRLPLPSWLSSPATSTLTLTSNALPDAVGTTIETATIPAAPPWFARPEGIALAIWLAGIAIGLSVLCAGLARLWLLARRAVTVHDGAVFQAAADAARATGVQRPVQLLASTHPTPVMTWGVLRPKVLLPAAANDWTEERLRIVIAHELSHVRRGDWGVQMLASLLQCLYWFNPLVWIACRRLRLESERACDDAVLTAGVAGADYASHLLAVARDAVRLRHAWTPANAIAHPSTLEGRIHAMLNASLNRAPLTRLARSASVVALGAMASAIAAAAVSAQPAPAGGTDITLSAPAPIVEPQTPERAVAAVATPASAVPVRPDVRSRATAAPAQLPPATITGTVLDQSGGVLPGVRLTLTDTEVGVKYDAVSDGTGTFSFRELPPARYELVATLPGFRTVRNTMDIPAGTTVQRTLTLPIGALQDTITVVCGSAPAATGGNARAPFASTVTRTRTWPLFPFAAQDQSAPQPVRVGGQIRVPRQVTKVNPKCPDFVGTGTVIILQARIGVDGYLNEVESLRPAPGSNSTVPRELVESALDAVRQWTYTPALLNNVPVEAVITVTVQFTRG